MQFGKKEGINVTRQTYFCGLYQLAEDSVLLSDLITDNTIRLDVRTPKAERVLEKEFWAEKNTWLIHKEHLPPLENHSCLDGEDPRSIGLVACFLVCYCYY